MSDGDPSDLYVRVIAMIDKLSNEEQVKVAEYISVCPYDCDSGCHDEDCICDRLGCAGSEAPGAK